MYRRAVLFVTILMLFSGFTGAIAQVGGPDKKPEVQTGCLEYQNVIMPMVHNGSDQMKYDAKDYDISVTFDPAAGELTATAVLTVTTLKDIDHLNFTLLGSLTVTRVRDGTLTDLVYDMNATNHRLNITLAAQELKGTDISFQIEYNGNLTRSYSNDIIMWEGSHLESKTPWYPMPYFGYGFNPTRPRTHDLHNATVHITVPSTWTGVSMGQFLNMVDQGATKEFNYQSVAPVRGVSVAAADFFLNYTTYKGVNISTYKYIDNATQSGAFIDHVKSMLDWFTIHYGTYPYTDFRMVEIRELAENLYVSDQGLMLSNNINRSTPPLEIAVMMADQFLLYDTTPIGSFDTWLTLSFSEYAAIYYQLNAEGKDLRLKTRKTQYGKGAENSIESISPGNNRWDEVIFSKGPYVLHMFRYLVGNTTFDTVMKDYVARSSGTTTDLDTFMSSVGAATSMDLDWFWTQWLNTTKVLDYSVVGPNEFTPVPAIVYEEDGQIKVEVKITQNGVAVMPLDLGVFYDTFEKETFPNQMSKDENGKTVILNVTGHVMEVVVNPDNWLLDTKKDNDKTLTVSDDFIMTEFVVDPKTDVTGKDVLALEATILNDGDNTHDVNVEFYDNGVRIDKVLLEDVLPTKTRKAFANWTALKGSRNLSVLVDSDLVIREMNESNNMLNMTVEVAEYIPPPDLYFVGGITPSRENVTEGELLNLTATIFNNYKFPISGIKIEFFADGLSIVSDTLGAIASNDTVNFTASWSTLARAHTLTVDIIAPVGITEADTTNNHLSYNIYINEIPFAGIGVDNEEPFTGEEVIFESSSSNDDGKITAYRFDFGDGTIRDWSSAATAKHAYSTPGTYRAMLKVKDNLTVESEWSDPLDIVVQNTMPIADFDIFPDDEGTIHTVFKFIPDATDSDGTIVEYSWDFGDEETTNKEQPMHQFRDDKEFTVTMTVKDNDNKWSEPVQKTIVIHNVKPNVIGAISPTTVLTGDPVILDASQSWDPDDERAKLSYKWTADGRIISTKAKDINVKFSTKGTYSITLTVKDDDGASNTTEIGDVVVNDRPKITDPDDDGPDNTMLYMAAGGGIAALVIIMALVMMMKGAAKKKAVAAKRPRAKKKKVKGEAIEDDEEIEEVEEVEEDDEDAGEEE